MTTNRLTFWAAAGSFALLLGAFVFEFLGYAPCTMCIWQRWPHAIAIMAGLAWLVRPGCIWLIIGALGAFSTAVIGFYHTGVEKGIFEGPSTCTSNGVENLSADELFDQIMAAPLIRCDEVAWQFLTLSMASWNMIFSAILGCIWLVALVKYRN